MLNHARTLLINRSSANSPGLTFFGEELMPGQFTELTLPSFLLAIRRILFGRSPDRAMLNYRASQFLTLLHSTRELGEYVLDLDSRITYPPGGDVRLMDPALYQPAAVPVGDSPELVFLGEPTQPDESGIIRHSLQVTIASEGTAEVRRYTSPAADDFIDYTLSQDLSTAIPLTGTGYSFKVRGGTGAWAVEVFNKPQVDLGSLAATLKQAGAPVLLELFGVQAAEPYTTFRALWEDHPELPSQLGGLLLALIYRTEEVRRGNG